MTQADHDTELQDWIDSLDELLEREGNEHVEGLLRRLQAAAYRRGVRMPFSANTPQINTIPVEQQVAYPGDLELERRIKSLVRWNAMAMVVRANREADGIGGHISTYASAATLYEVAFNHFFRAPTNDQPGDIVYFQGHAAPGIYARAFLEGRLSREQLENFRRELKPGGGLSSYPHPWLMPGFWQFPTVSMGLAPLMAIYQARFNRYLEDRGLLPHGSGRVWAFIGDGETDEPESRGAISVAAREQLDNLVFVINCNLQRLDGPVRGNGQIIQELEALLRGAGWNVIKVVLGGDWDPLLAKDEHGRLVERWTEVLDGELQKYTVEPGSYLRERFWGKHPELAAMVAHLSDAQLKRLRLGGHDPVKLFAAYKAATEHRGAPTAILARTIKGYGLGEAGEGRNVTHQQKKLNEEELREFRARFGIPISDEDLARAPLYRPPDDSPEVVYIRQRREQLGGFLPERRVQAAPLEPPPAEPFAEFFEGTGERPVSTTMAFVRLLARLMKHERFGPLVVPIVPDEARTFGMESLFRQFGIYSHAGQLYEPVDAGSLLYYREATDGQILEEGITEAGAMGSFIAAGTAYATHGINTIPFFIYYSMFGFQRIGDLIWAAADMRVKGFLVGATAGRTTLAGEGLQHQDGHSHHLMQVVPTLRCYDPAFAYEIAVIVREGLRRMYTDREDCFYYLTVTNENYPMPAVPGDIDDDVVAGMYRYLRIGEAAAPQVTLLASGAIVNEAVAAAHLLADRFAVSSDVWSVTSWSELRRDALATERWNLLHPEARPHVPRFTSNLADGGGPIIAASDYLKAVPDALARWAPRRMQVLGTDGFGRSDTREALRDFFEVDARHIAFAAVAELYRDAALPAADVERARKELAIDPDRPDPVCC